MDIVNNNGIEYKQGRFGYAYRYSTNIGDWIKSTHTWAGLLAADRRRRCTIAQRKKADITRRKLKRTIYKQKKPSTNQLTREGS